MRSAADPINAAFGRSSDLLDQVDYRLAQTPEEKEEIYNLRYRAYLREGAVKESVDQRVTDQYDDLPNAWTFGIYIRGELFSSVRISVLTREWRQSCSAEAFGEILFPRLDRGEIIIDPTRFVADPEKAKRFPELPYVTLRLAYLACEYFNADLGLAIASDGMLGIELESGAVQEALADWRLPSIDISAVFPTGRRASAKARAFAAFVERELATGTEMQG